MRRLPERSRCRCLTLEEYIQLELAETTVDLLASVTSGEANSEPVQRLLPFEIYTPENL